MPKANITKSSNISIQAREIDFVSRFSLNWEKLREVLGIMRPIKKEPGAVLKTKKATVVLQSGNVAEGEEIPFSEANIVSIPYEEMSVEKYAKSTTIEAIKEHGYNVAVGMTDDQFLYELQNNVTGRFYDYLKTGALTSVQSNFQMALAMAKGYVVNRFKQMSRTATKVVAFVNVLDVYECLGAANITIQTAFGFDYIKNFMGYDTVFLLSDSEIKRGMVIATPVENIVLYYVDPSTSDFAKAGLEYEVDGETPLIGFHAQGNYSTATSECYALMGMTLFSEFIDGIAVVRVASGGTIGSLTVTSAAGTEVGNSKLTVAGAVEDKGATYFYKAGATAPTVTYLETLDETWKVWNGESEIAGLTASQKITVVEANGTRQALASGNATIAVKS